MRQVSGLRKRKSPAAEGASAPSHPRQRDFRLKSLLEESTKRWSKPLGLACATFLSSWPSVFRQLRCVHKKRGIGACKYTSKRLKASCASYTQRARAACFVPVMQKMQINRDFPLSPVGAVAKRLGLGSYLHEKRSLISRSNSFFCGDGRTRTAVQTPHQRAFYTLSLTLIVG